MNPDENPLIRPNVPTVSYPQDPDEYVIEHLLSAQFEPRETPEIAIAIASHIVYDGQISRLEKCINSLLNQTKPCDILLSISFEHKKYKLEFSKRIAMNKSLKIFIADTQKYQMEHLQILSKHCPKYQLILFSDDDDEYDPERVAIFHDAFIKARTKNPNIAGVVELRDNKNHHTNKEEKAIGEFWQYGVVPSVIDVFFKRIKGEEMILKHYYGDMVFTEYLKRSSKEWCEITPDRELYKYDSENSNGVRNRLQASLASDPSYETKLEAIRKNEYMRAIFDGCSILNFLFDLMIFQCQSVYPESERVVREIIRSRKKRKVWYLKHLFDKQQRECSGC